MVMSGKRISVGVGACVLVAAACGWLAQGCGDNAPAQFADGGIAGHGGSGGSGGLGGAGGAGTGGTTGAPVSFTFDSDMQGFAFDTFQSPDPTAVRNLAAPPVTFVADGGAGGAGATTAADGGVDDGGTDAASGGAGGAAGTTANPNPPTLELDNSIGNPNPGSLKATVPFTDFNQMVDITKRFDVSTLQNMSGRALHVEVRLSSGTFYGGAVLYVITTTAYTFTYSGWTVLPPGQWREITIDLGNKPGADQVIGFGVTIGTGGQPVPGQVFTPTTPVFNIDSFTD
jgi:hypothetical protein